MAPINTLQDVRNFIAERIALPTSTTLQGPSRVVLPRQATTTVVSDTVVYSDGAGLTGGQIAGIVIGSIAGFLLLCWILRACVNLGRPEGWGRTFEPAYEKPVPRRHSTHRSRSRHSRHSHRSPRRTVEVDRERDVYYSRQGPIPSQSRGRSPRAPPAVYKVKPNTNARDARDARRASRNTRYYSG